jgi:hypothetical protein
MSLKNPKFQAILLGILGIILFGFSIYSTISLFSPKAKPEVSSPTPNPTPKLSIKTEKNEYFQIKYANDWEVTKRSIAGGGYIFYLKSQNSAKILNYQLELEAFQKNDQASLATLTAPLETFGYQKSNTSFLNRLATKLEVTFPPGMIPKSDPKKSVKKEMYIIENAKAFYRISFIYYQDQPADLAKLQEVVKTLVIDQ